MTKKHSATVIESPEAPTPVDPQPVVVPNFADPASKLVCPNCGTTGMSLTVSEGKFECQSCQHQWTSEADSAPFRRIQRGEL